MQSTAYLWLKVYHYMEQSSQGFRQDRLGDALKAKKNSTQKKRLYDLIAYAEYGVGCQVTVNTTDAEAQTVYSYANIMSENVIIKSENQRLLDCLFDLKRQADVLSLTPEFFQSNEDNLKFYTGM